MNKPSDQKLPQSEAAVDRLEDAIQMLPDEISPGRDLWPGIEYSLTEQPTERWKLTAPAYAIAASLMLSVSVLWFGLQPTDNSAITDAPPNVAQIAQELSQQFEHDKQLMMAGYADQPALTPDWRQQLLDMDNSIELILTALEQNPDNRALLDLLQQVYKQQLRLIQNVHHVRPLDV